MHRTAQQGFKFRCCLRDDVYFAQEQIAVQAMADTVGTAFVQHTMMHRIGDFLLRALDPQGAVARSDFRELLHKLYGHLVPWVKLDQSMTQAETSDFVQAWKRAFPHASTELIELEAERAAQIGQSRSADDLFKVI